MDSQDFEFKLDGSLARISDEVVLKAIDEFARTMGRRFSMSEWNAWSAKPCCSTTIFKRFGSWPNALRAAGINAPDHGAFTPEELMQKLEAAWRKLGRPPGAKTLKQAAGISYSAYRFRWGSLRAACERLAAHKRGDLSREDLLKPAIRRNVVKRAVPASLRFRVLERDGNKCVVCGHGSQDGVRLEVDHIVPLSKGGGNEIENLRTLCSLCNRGKSDRIPEDKSLTVQDVNRRKAA